jgi:hypothetical protein
VILRVPWSEGFFGESVLFGRSLCFEGCEVTVGRLLCIIEGGDWKMVFVSYLLLVAAHIEEERGKKNIRPGH